MTSKYQPTKNTKNISSEEHDPIFRPRLSSGKAARGNKRRLGVLAQVKHLVGKKPLPPAGRGGRRGRGAVPRSQNRYAQRVVVKARVV